LSDFKPTPKIRIPRSSCIIKVIWRKREVCAAIFRKDECVESFEQLTSTLDLQSVTTYLLQSFLKG